MALLLKFLIGYGAVAFSFATRVQVMSFEAQWERMPVCVLLAAPCGNRQIYFYLLKFPK
jgi:hypothetical protein